MVKLPGPGAIGAVILLMANVEGDIAKQSMVVFGLLSLMLGTFVAILGASQLHKLLGVTGLHVITRIFGVILSALAVQFMFDGIKQSGVFS